MNLHRRALLIEKVGAVDWHRYGMSHHYVYEGRTVIAIAGEVMTMAEYFEAVQFISQGGTHEYHRLEREEEDLAERLDNLGL